MIGALTTHLWQSTCFAAAVALLSLAFRGNRARVRYGLWLCASVKFLVPFSLFIGLGGQFAARRVDAPAVPLAVERMALSFAEPVSFAINVSPSPNVHDWKPFALGGVWLGGIGAIALMRLRGWRRVRAALRASAPLDLSTEVEIRSAPGLLEPGVVGLLRPVLLLPDGIVTRLTASQLEAVLAHELCHVRRRDNLWAALHMLVEAAFWFHPLVWWIGARMVEERERACDEGVLSLGSEPRTYAEAILGVCKLYVESPLACVSGVTGADLKTRIEAIMNNRIGLGLNFTKKLLLAAAGVVALAGPVITGVVIGVGHAPALRAQLVAPLPAAARSAAPAPLTASAPNVAPQRSNPPATPAPQMGRMLTLLFDCGSMTSEEQTRARNAAIQYVQTRMQAGDLMSVMVATSGKLAVAQDFTADPALLIAAISGAGSSVESNAGSQIATLQQAAKMLGAIPGKKALLYFSSPTPQQVNPDNQALKDAIQTAVDNNVAFYSIDVGGGRSAAMNRVYTRHGQPDHIDDRGASGQVWTYNYLDSFHSRVEYGFDPGKGGGASVLYPPPVLYPGVSADGTTSFSSRHAELRAYPAGEPQVLSMPLDGLTGKIDLVGDVRRVLSDGRTEMAANVRDSVTINTPNPSANGTYSATFILDAGSYVAKILAREQITGKLISEVINFDVR